jgi:hypothetical protein
MEILQIKGISPVKKYQASKEVHEDLETHNKLFSRSIVSQTGARGV